MEARYNRNGGLTLVPMPGFCDLADKVRNKVENMGVTPGKEPTSVDVVKPLFGTRLSGEPFLRLGKDHIGGHDCVVLSSGPGTYQMLLQLFLILRYLAGRRAQRIAVVTGYLPLGRTDRDEGSLEFALPPLINELLMASSQGLLDRIIAADLHSPQVVMAGRTGLITEVSLVRRLLSKATDEARKRTDRICLALPDDGAAKRIENAFDEVEKKLNTRLPIVFGAKRRTSSRESSLKQLFGDLDALRDAHVILLDDEIASGGTNLKTALALKRDYGAKQVWAAATHGVFCGEAPTLFLAPDCQVDRIFVTDTIPLEPRAELAPLLQSGKLAVVSWWEDLAWMVYHHHWDKSIREMR